MTWSRDMEVALCRSALYEALAAGFRSPTAATVERLAAPEGAAGLVVAGAALDPDLGERVRALAGRPADLETLQMVHTRLFGHTARGEVPAYETEYGTDDAFRQPHELADLGGFYAAFGLRVDPRIGERPDHVSCECEFLLVLARREALGLEREDAAMIETARAATRLFVRDHFARFAPAFAGRLRRADPSGFYGALGHLTGALVGFECRRLGVNGGADALGLRPAAAADAAPMACGGCELAVPGSPEPDVD